MIPLNSSKRIAGFRNDAFFSLTGFSFSFLPHLAFSGKFSLGSKGAGETAGGPDAGTPPSDTLYRR